MAHHGAAVGHAGAGRRWGREIEVSHAKGYPCRRYRDRPLTLPELLLDARRWRGREFAVQGARRLTFEQFEAAVARVAHRLRAEGIGSGARVMLLGFNRIEWLAAFWAIQCVGAVAVLGNAWWSDAECSAAVALVEPAMVLSDRQPAGRSLDGSPCPGFGELAPLVDDGGDHALEVTWRREEDVAVIMFSSGTTGAAKGVQMSHGGIIANIQNLLALAGRLPDELPLDRPGTVSLLASPLFHLAGVQIQINTLLSGGKVIFLEGRFDPAQVLRIIEREKVRVWGGIPAMVQRVVDHPALDRFDTSSVASVPMGGAAIPPQLREKIKAAFPATSRRVGSLYGHTEAGGVLAAGAGAELDGRPGCVGRALPVVELRIDNPDADGVGEVLARTPTATSGYLGESGPLEDSEGWIRSGDLGRIDADGYLYLVGRSKDIIIRGGENIASVHVERCLLTHPAVLEAAVVPLPHAVLGEEVGACLVLRTPQSSSQAEIEAFVAARLARFEVPTRWWLRREPLPMNPSGKVLKREVIRSWPQEPPEGHAS
ncbi:class I adenylate-forming enzyme family protein [Vineibacter terrae]|uniref:class I adenylate-forming enzyme family protein n=1 Tax=Vineibacter terrae TaxID=2586908 RepID=UPI002E31B1E1|nr:class I adenylate-forming enzyme family protein [Vineibacter terrae]HEX2888934.1 class I adenylate-forming enzyme family protein [Vineibacter terrae]